MEWAFVGFDWKATYHLNEDNKPFINEIIFDMYHTLNTRYYMSAHDTGAQIYRGYLLFWGEYQIYSSSVKNIRIFTSAGVKILMFTTHKMKYIWYLQKKIKFSFYYILFMLHATEKGGAKNEKNGNF